MKNNCLILFFYVIWLWSFFINNGSYGQSNTITSNEEKINNINGKYASLNLNWLNHDISGGSHESNSFHLCGSFGSSLPAGFSNSSFLLWGFIPISYPLDVYSITGYVRDRGGNGISGVTVSLSGHATNTYTTAANGYYEFTNLAPGNYTVTANRSGSSFTPSEFTYSPLNSNQYNMNFTAFIGFYSINGYVRDSGGNGISDVTVSLSGHATNTYTTSANGYYEFTNLAPGNYTVTANRSGSSFTPSEFTYSPLNSNQYNKNFTAFIGIYSINGYVRDSGRNGISGIPVSLLGHATILTSTLINGYYEFTNLSSGNYTVMPSLYGWSFTPSEYTYNPLNSNQPNQNFKESQVVYSINGYVRDTSGNGISGVTVSLSGHSTNTYSTSSDGYYEFTDLASSNYTVTPNISGWSFTPSEFTYNPLNLNQPNQNFKGSKVVYFIKGYIRDSDGTGISGVTVSLSGHSTNTYSTLSDGYYEFINLVSGDYTVTPSISGWNFTPPELSYSLLSSNQTNENFKGKLSTPNTGKNLSNKNVYAYPNPFNLAENNFCCIRFSLATSASVTIEIYDVSNRLVIRLLKDNLLNSGVEQSINWDGKNSIGQQVANGTYFYIITSDQGERATGALIILN